MLTTVFDFASSALSYLLPFVVVLSIVVFVHEFGHFWVARRCGVRVMTFSIGFGQEIFGWNNKLGMRWKVAWLPLGGYVKMFGDSDPTSALPEEGAVDMTADEKKVAFFSQSLAKRMAIVFAGPASNYLFAIVVMAGLFLVNGQPYTAPLVDKVVPGSVAEQTGFLPGDRVLTIDDHAIDSFEDIKRIVSLNAGTAIDVTLERGEARQTIHVTPEVVQSTDRFGGEHHVGRLGISSTMLEYRKLSPVAAIQESVIQAWELSASTLRGVGQMIMGTRGTEELGGPLRIAEMSGKVAQEDMGALVFFLVLISINLGLINLFPVPLLDGGHLAFYIIEFLRGRPMGDKAQEFAFRVGALMVASLMVFATWQDLVHLRVISFLRNLFS